MPELEGWLLPDGRHVVDFRFCDLQNRSSALTKRMQRAPARPGAVPPPRTTAAEALASHAAALYGALGYPLRQGVVLFGLGQCAEGAEAYLCGLTPSDDGVDVRRKSALAAHFAEIGDYARAAVWFEAAADLWGMAVALADRAERDGDRKGLLAARDGFERAHRSGTRPPGSAGAPGPRLPHSTRPSTSRPAICSGSAPPLSGRRVRS